MESNSVRCPGKKMSLPDGILRLCFGRKRICPLVIQCKWLSHQRTGREVLSVTDSILALFSALTIAGRHAQRLQVLPARAQPPR